MKKHYLALMSMAVLSIALVFGGCGKNENAAEGTDAAEGTETVETTEDADTVEETEDAETVVETESTEATEDVTSEADTEKSEGVMTYAEYVAADLDTEVVVETYVQAKQSWWEDKATLYTQDADGAYFIYSCACSQEDYDKLVEGTKIRVTGYKSEWSGEVEIVDATFEILEGSYVATPVDVTELLGSDDLVNYQNQKVTFTGMTVEDAGNGEAFMYNWDGSGTDGDDLYFNVSYNGQTYSFTVESYLCDNTTDVYAAVKNLQIGDTVDLEGFLYWYEGVNPHITAVTVK